MATEILAVGSTAANSSEIVVEAGDIVTVSIKGGTGYPYLYVEMKDDDDEWVVVDNLTSPTPAKSIVSPGTYRLRRAAGSVCGAFSV